MAHSVVPAFVFYGNGEDSDDGDGEARGVEVKDAEVVEQEEEGVVEQEEEGVEEKEADLVDEEEEAVQRFFLALPNIVLPDQDEEVPNVQTPPPGALGARGPWDSDEELQEEEEVDSDEDLVEEEEMDNEAANLSTTESEEEVENIK